MPDGTDAATIPKEASAPVGFLPGSQMMPISVSTEPDAVASSSAAAA
jgi:hypothetical protein